MSIVEIVADVISQHLRRPADTVSDLFKAGLDSMGIVDIILECEERVGRTLEAERLDFETGAFDWRQIAQAFA